VEGNGRVVPIIVVGWVVESHETVSNGLWFWDVGFMCMMTVVPLFCGVVASSMIVVDGSCTRGSSRICMMAGLDGEVNGVESLMCDRGGVVCN
jgi:hypothetical protein